MDGNLGPVGKNLGAPAVSQEPWGQPYGDFELGCSSESTRIFKLLVIFYFYFYVLITRVQSLSGTVARGAAQECKIII